MLQQNIRLTLRQLPLFAEVSEQQLTSIAVHARCVSVSKEEMLFQKGDTAHGFYIVLEGQVKLVFPSAQGHERILAILGRGQSFGEAVMFLKSHYPVRAEALTAARLLYLPGEEIFSLLQGDPHFAGRMLAGMALRLHSLVHDVELTSRQSSVQRVTGYLLQMGTPATNGTSEVELPVSKQTLALHLNLRPETLSRILRDMTDAGLIRMQGRRILLRDVPGLEQYGS